METLDKMRQLGSAAQLDVVAPLQTQRRRALEPGICATSGGDRSALLRVLMTDSCIHDCQFCPLRASAPRRRTAFAPDELARLFQRLHQGGKVDGLFLSSAVADSANTTMEQMLATAEILRRDQFEGYIHLKLLPGSSDSIVEAAARLANRVSINIEVPTAAYLQQLGTGKEMGRDILHPMRLLHRMEQQGFLPGGLSTQYVVGAAGESDQEIMSSVDWLNDEVGLRRAHFGLLQLPPEVSPAMGQPGHPQRPGRLYQADWLRRVYGLRRDEVTAAFDGTGNLPLGVDPKVSIALARPQQFPLDVNSASYDELLRVPGIGPVAASRIVTLRNAHSFSDLGQLKKTGVAVARAAPFILINGRQPQEAAAYHQRLSRKRAATPAEFGVQLTLPGFE